MTSKELAKIACMALDGKKGLDIISLNVEGRTIICDYFVICSGKNSPQVKALCDNVVEKFDEIGLNSRSREGYAEGRWIVLDYGDVVVHIFNDETRLFYHLERLWTFEDNMEKYVPEVKEEVLPLKKKRTTKTAEEKAVKTIKTVKTAPKTSAVKAKETGLEETVKKPRVKKTESLNSIIDETVKPSVKKPRILKAKAEAFDK